jgi:HD-GYP domain-containing protein (c-di-GMP phosphodiesterase class II)
MENVSQLAMMVIFLGAGSVTGVLVDRERRRVRHKVVEALAALETALGFRHEPTRLHAERVAALAVRIGRALSLSRTQLERLRLAALVHDLGKIGVTDDVLLKPSDLGGDERVHVERHPVVAGDILRNLNGAEEIAKIVLAHHERLDGSGYPRHLRAAAIPVEARILAVADVFCALEEPRPYKPALSSAEILEAMAPMAGTKLDVDAFRALESMIHEGHTAAS